MEQQNHLKSIVYDNYLLTHGAQSLSCSIITCRIFHVNLLLHSIEQKYTITSQSFVASPPPSSLPWLFPRPHHGLYGPLGLLHPLCLRPQRIVTIKTVRQRKKIPHPCLRPSPQFQARCRRPPHLRKIITPQLQ